MKRKVGCRTGKGQTKLEGSSTHLIHGSDWHNVIERGTNTGGMAGSVPVGYFFSEIKGGEAGPALFEPVTWRITVLNLLGIKCLGNIE